MGKSSIIPVAFMLFAVPAVSFQNRFLTARTSWGKKLQLAASALEPPLERSMFLESSDQADIQTLKSQVLQLAASLDRGQSYNPTSGEYYRERFEVARQKVEDLVAAQPGPLPTSLEEMEGEWELVFTSVKHGIFRSSPFFLAIQEAFGFSEEPLAFGQPKADLFFKLHELQTCSWGASKIGRVAQVIDAEKGMLFSEFDTSLFSLTVIPILGWFKLLPTFGGCVITASKCRVTPGSRLEMEVEYTTSKPVPGLQVFVYRFRSKAFKGLGEWIWSVKVPVGAVWKLLPWNQGRPASCSVAVVYLDSDFRVVQDNDGELFVYTRPVVPRP